MKPLTLAILSLAFFAAQASASTSVPRVDAVADALPADSLSMACSKPRISAADVHRVLGTHPAYQTASLRDGLLSAVGDACAQNVARIVVTRRGMDVAWSPASSIDSAVAIALR